MMGPVGNFDDVIRRAIASNPNNPQNAMMLQGERQSDNVVQGRDIQIPLLRKMLRYRDSPFAQTMHGGQEVPEAPVMQGDDDLSRLAQSSVAGMEQLRKQLMHEAFIKHLRSRSRQPDQFPMPPSGTQSAPPIPKPRVQIPETGV